MMKESGENYLETIYLLIKAGGECRSVDIVEKLGYSKSSVSRGVNLLKDRGYIQMKPSGEITLTKEGLERAEKIYEKHKILTTTFEKLGVSSEIAEKDACVIEHVISEETFDAFKKLLEKL